MIAPAPTSRPSTEAEDRMKAALANWLADQLLDELTGPEHHRYAEAVFAGPLAPLLERITAAEARAKTERSNREQWAIQAHEFAAAADRLAREKDAATADRDRLADEVARLRGALKPFADAAKVVDTDTMQRMRPDSTTVWTATGSWSQPATVTIGHLRAARRALTATGGTTDG